MKFDVGYQLYPDYTYINEIIKRKENISGVYFSWGDFPNGRNNQLKRADMLPWEAQTKQQKDLEILSKENISLNLLFNANCYGKDSQSRAFFQEIGEVVDFCLNNYSLKTITTTSPLIAKFIKTNFNNIQIRASVNMGIGTVDGMEYVKEYFDSFYLKRELNRDFKKIKELKCWCDANGKNLYGLANSGCLNNCSAHAFHDNLVSHESEISKMDNGYEFSGICHDYLKKDENIYNYLDITGFIRPEDVYLYEELFDSLKLATRVNTNPVRILKSYIDYKSHRGNVMELLEPNHSVIIKPYIIENSFIKSKTENEKLIYENIEKALVKLEGNIYVD